MTYCSHALAALRADPAMAPLSRSLSYYYGDPDREAELDRFYRRFVRPGDLVIDVGAHVGDRVAAFRRLGARVVAVEPQPLCAEALRRLYAADEQVTVIAAACGERTGRVPFHVNSANPTVSTRSARFAAAAAGAPGWETQEWDARIMVRSVTLDALVRRFGVPAFIKIDVEGYEDGVLAGLSRPVPALSFEFTTIARGVARDCLHRLARLGCEGFDVSLGESLALTFGQWVSRERMTSHLLGLPHDANAGDIYAVWPHPATRAGHGPDTGVSAA
jgi:FkbM family methyltransferase